MQDVCKELKAAISAFSWQSAERKYDKYRLDQRDAETARAADARIAALPKMIASRDAARHILEERRHFFALAEPVRALCTAGGRLLAIAGEAERYLAAMDKSDADALDARLVALINEKNSKQRCERIAAQHAALSSVSEGIRAGVPHFSAFLALFRSLPTLKEAAAVDGEIRALGAPRTDADAQRVLSYKKKFDTLARPVCEAVTEANALQALVRAAEARLSASRASAAQRLTDEIAALLSESNTPARCDRIKALMARLSATEPAVRAQIGNYAALEALYKKMPALREAAEIDAALCKASLTPEKNQTWANETLALLARVEGLHAAVAAECGRLSLITALKKEADTALMAARLERYKARIRMLMREASEKKTLAACDALIEAYEKRSLTKEEESMAAPFLTSFKKAYENARCDVARLLSGEAAPYLSAMTAPADFARLEALDAEKEKHARALATVQGFEDKWKSTKEASYRLAEENGVKLFQSKKYAEALRALDYAVKHGKGRAALFCGRILEFGFTGKVDREGAFGYYKLADERGEGDAAYSLGRMYLNGLGTKKDTAAALRCLEKAAGAKSIPATALLGEMYLDGRGVKQDYQKALSYLKTAVDANLPSAEYNLGRILEEGLGTGADPDGALKLYASASVSIDAAKEKYAALKKKLDDAAALDKEIAALIAMPNSLDRIERLESANKRFDAIPSSFKKRVRNADRLLELYAKISSLRTCAVLDRQYEEAVGKRGTADFITAAESFIKKFYAYPSITTKHCLAYGKVQDLEAELKNVKNSWLLENARTVYKRHVGIPFSEMTADKCKSVIRDLSGILKNESLLQTLDAELCRCCKEGLEKTKKRLRAIYSEEATPYLSAMRNAADYARILSLGDSVAAHREALLAIEPDFDQKWQSALANARALRAEAIALAEQRAKQQKDEEINRIYNLAMCNDASAQYKLACLYLYGDGVTRDLKRAVEFFEKSAHRGNKDAMEKLGDCYTHGWGVPVSYAKAEKWYKKALK